MSNCPPHFSGGEFGGEHLSEEAARLLALELYREDKVSLGRAAELCQTPLGSFMDFVAEARRSAAAI